MIYPDVSLEKWFKKYPFLKDYIPLTCICGKQVYEVTPYYTHLSAGISTGVCECGIKAAETCSMPRNERCRQIMAEIFS
jgi:hypothetical protein